MKLQFEENEYYLMKDGEELAIATTDESFIKELGAERLSKKNCQAIENGYDLDELVYEEFQKFDQEVRIVYRRQLQESLAAMFNKALKILGDKKFSEDDVIYMIERSNKMNFTAKHLISNHKKTEWLVEIEMEFNPINHASGLEITGNELMDIAILENYKPKLDADGCLILKRK